MKHYRERWLFGLLLFGAPPVDAFVNLPQISPATPQAGEPVSVIVNAGHCDGLLGTFELRIADDVLILTVDGIRSYSICGIPVQDTSFAIGAFPVGSYTLQLDYHYNADFPNDEGTETVGTIQFDVAPAGGTAVASVPAMDLVGRIGLTLSLLAISAIALRWRLR